MKKSAKILSLSLMASVGLAYAAPLQQTQVIQTIEFNSDEVFPEGGEFLLIKQDDGCMVKGYAYTAYARIMYQFHLKKDAISKATKTVYDYEMPIFENPNAKVARVHSYHLNDKEYFQDMQVIALIYDSISQEAKFQCL